MVVSHKYLVAVSESQGFVHCSSGFDFAGFQSSYIGGARYFLIPTGSSDSRYGYADAQVVDLWTGIHNFRHQRFEPKFRMHGDKIIDTLSG